ncbi:MAG: DUF2029 domain-containing protein [Chloroflexi bacterium]|nr:DUF2029 domain-containing protein [Chloroflexota bacterium]
MSEHVRHYGKWLGVAALWLALIAIAWVFAFRSGPGMFDFRVYLTASQQLVEGMHLYPVEAQLYHYPPLLAQLLMPLAKLPVETAETLWFAGNVVLLTGLTAVFSRINTLRARWWLITLCFLPLADALQIGQITIVLLALLAGAWYAARTNRPFLCGALLALATWIKIYPVLLIVYFIWKRDWRIVGSALIVGIILLALQIAISGIGVFDGMFQTLFALTDVGELDTFSKNASINGFSSQLFAAHPLIQALIVNPLLAGVVRAAISLGLILTSAWVTRARVISKRQFDLEYGVVLVVMLLLSPTLYTSGMPPLLLVFFLLLLGNSTRHLTQFVVAVCLSLSIYWLFVMGYTGTPPVSGLLLSFGFYALLATWGVIVWRLQRQPVTAAPLVEAYSVEGSRQL